MKTADPKQEELAFSAMKAHALFPGRVTLYVFEVARALGVTVKHVINLIEAGELKAINIASDIKGGVTESGRAKASFYRVPVGAFDEYIAKRRSDR